MTVPTLFSIGGFEKIRTYLEHRKHSENIFGEQQMTESLSKLGQQQQEQRRREWK